MKVFVSIFFGAAVILTAYSNVGAWQSAIVLWRYGSRRRSQAREQNAERGETESR